MVSTRPLERFGKTPRADVTAKFGVEAEFELFDEDVMGEGLGEVVDARGELEVAVSGSECAIFNMEVDVEYADGLSAAVRAALVAVVMVRPEAWRGK